MDIFTIPEIMIFILDFIDIRDIFYLFNTNMNLKEIISNIYVSSQIDFEYMPSFRKCETISIYFHHYNSFITGKNFPDEPSWLFDKGNDCKFIIQDTNIIKYKKIDNIRYDRQRFRRYITSYNFLPFQNALYHWKYLTPTQKYVIWCAIRGYHPEIKLDKSLCDSHTPTLIHEIFWHYDNSFSRQYLEIYLIDNCDLINSKCIGKSEIDAELEFMLKYPQYLKLVPYSQALKYYHYTHTAYRRDILKLDQILEGLILKPDLLPDQILNKDYILKEIEKLNVILTEIKQFNITRTGNLNTGNINYLEHMISNYTSNDNLSDMLSTDVNGCTQQ